MKVIVSAGGTGGHLYPALALAEYIKKQDPESEFLFVGTIDRLEAEIVPSLGYPYKGLKVKGMVGNPLNKLKNAFIFIKSLHTSKQILKEFKPDIVVGFGGYPSASIVLAASFKKIKTMIHEQNSIIGLTNKILIKRVDEIICCYEKAYQAFPKEKTKLLGNPRAQAVHETELTDIHDLYNVDKKRKIVVIVMGSLGSATINDLMKKALEKFNGLSYDIIYATGKAHYEEMKTFSYQNNIHIVPYIDDMPSVLSSCDLLVTRGGATTLAEITSLGTPAVIIPSPYVVANHQEYNARELCDHGAAEMILEKDLTAENLFKKINNLMIHDDLRIQRKQASMALGKPQACHDIYQEILKLIKRN